MGGRTSATALRWSIGMGVGLAAGLAVGLTAGPGAIARPPKAVAAETAPAAALPLRPVDAAAAAAALQELSLGDRQALLTAIQHSLTYLATPKAAEDYRNYPVPGVSRDRVWRSLQRLRHLVATSPDAATFQRALGREFVLYESVGADGAGTVAYTGYFEPQYRASAVPTAEYRYPLYRRPPDLERWPQPHPTRLALEGATGLAADQGPLAGLELVWLASRLEAFLVQVQGSAQLRLTDGRVLSVGYAGRTEYPYTSIGRLLVADGKLAAEDLSLPNLIAYFEAQPAELDRYLPQNDRFVFFREGDGGPPTGSLSVPVTAGYSIATDKSVLPPGAIALIQLPLPQRTASGAWAAQPTTRLVLDQDTGGAILGPGRVDLFVGSGAEAGEVAGRINAPGRLYYLLLRP